MQTQEVCLVHETDVMMPSFWEKVAVARDEVYLGSLEVHMGKKARTEDHGHNVSLSNRRSRQHQSLGYHHLPTASPRH